MIYSVIDVETTGHGAGGNRITEIAIIQFDGEKIVNEYDTLVNPETNIPHKITMLTGISNEMVLHAPKFYEIAREVLELIEGTIFVAHNVSFDYTVINNEYKSLGGEIRAKKLCTVRLSRKIIPGHPSYSLGNICSALDIEINGRHRAKGDAMATVELLKILIDNDNDEIIPSFLDARSKQSSLPPNLPKEVYDKLPNLAGVYYMLNDVSEVIYVGKAIDIKKRINSHFSGRGNKKLLFLESIHNIDYVLTGNELMALLYESNEIKRLSPKFNRAQRRTTEVYGVCSYHDKKGYLRLGYNNLKVLKEPILSFYNISETREFLTKLVDSYKLCPKMCNIQTSPSSCFDFRIKKCKGACCGEESVSDYNKKVEAAIADMTMSDASFVIVEKGKSPDEKGIVLIENGHYVGFGYVDKDVRIESAESFRDHIDCYKDNKDIQGILRAYLKKSNGKNVLQLEN